MKRIIFCVCLLMLFTIGLAHTPIPAAASERVILKISTPAVPGDWHAEMLTVFKENLEQTAPGEFDVQIYLNGTLFSQGAEPAQMKRGNLEMALVSMQDIAKQIREYSIFTSGYLIRSPEHQKSIFYGDIGKEVFARVADVMDIHLLSVAYLGTRQLNLRTYRDVRTPADLKGVKLRMPGSRAWQFLGQALGASPTPMAFNEVYLALKTGTIDGQDNPLPTNQKAKFYEVTEQIVLTSHLVDGLFLAISDKTWKQLSAEQRAKVNTAAREAADFNDENRIRDEQRLIAFFRSEGLRITEPDLDAFRSHVQAAYLGSEFSRDWPEGLLTRINAAAP